VRFHRINCKIAKKMLHLHSFSAQKKPPRCWRKLAFFNAVYTYWLFKREYSKLKNKTRQLNSPVVIYTFVVHKIKNNIVDIWLRKSEGNTSLKEDRWPMFTERMESQYVAGDMKRKPDFLAVSQRLETDSAMVMSSCHGTQPTGRGVISYTLQYILFSGVIRKH